MAVGEEPVKRRAYDAQRRRDAAATRREAVLTVAERRFLSDGYAATTVGAVATDAGVSVDTIYKTFGGKPGLVRALWRRALEGIGPVPAEQRSDRLQTREPDPRRIIEGWGRFTAEVAPLATRILLLVRDAAAADPEVRTLRDELDADRLRRMTRNARRLRDNGHLRAGLSPARAADIMWTYTSAEMYELLVLRRGWTPESYGRFVADALIAALL